MTLHQAHLPQPHLRPAANRQLPVHWNDSARQFVSRRRLTPLPLSKKDRLNERFKFQMIQRQTLTFRSAIRYALQGLTLCTLATAGLIISTAGSETWALAPSFPLSFTPLLLALICCSWLCTATRFWLLCKSLKTGVNYRRALVPTLCVEFGIAASPGGVGGAAAFMGLLRQSGVPLATATSIMAADMVIDLLFFVLLAPFAAFMLLNHPDWRGVLGLQPKEEILLLVLLLGVLFMAGLWAVRKDHRWRRTEVWIRPFAGAKKHHFPARLRLLRWRIKQGLNSCCIAARAFLRRISPSPPSSGRHVMGSFPASFWHSPSGSTPGL